MKIGRRELVCFLVSLLVLEWLLYVCEYHLRFHHFGLLRKSWYEYQYFHYAKTPPPKEAHAEFHPRLGWWNPRNVFPATAASNKKRVLVFGDSFMNGINLPENETAPHYLQKKLGAGYEVINLAVPAYGLDQMVLAIRDYGLPLRPDYIILGFIAADLSRSCYDFAFNARKPVWRSGKGFDLTPVRSPYDTWSEHQSFLASARNAAASTLLRSRTVCLLGEFLLTPGYLHCLEKNNIAILESLKRAVPDPTRVLVVHLDSPIPPIIESSSKDLGFSYLSLEKIDDERYPDRHPKAALNRRYADSIATALRGVERTLSTISVAPSSSKFY